MTRERSPSAQATRLLTEAGRVTGVAYRQDGQERSVDASAVILAHNHPSGDPTPSRGDVEATRRIAEAGRALDICIHDHVIVARSGWTSFRALGLLQPARRN